MQMVLRCVLPLFAFWLGASIARADLQYVPDPDKYATDIMQLLVDKNVASASKMISDTIGKPSYADNLQKALNSLSSKNIDYSDKVIDNTFGKSLRHIIYYSFVESIGFIYFRFNFKMSSRGWILVNFIFKTETNDLFPKDFVDL